MIRYKQLIAPFVAVVFILLQTVLGVEVEEAVQNQVIDVLANLIAVSAVVYGIIHNNLEEKK